MLKNKRPVHKYCTLLLNLSMGREELGRSLKLSGEEPSLTREVVVPRGWANHCCFFISLASCSIPLDTNAIAGSAGQRKNQSFDFLARTEKWAPKEPENASRITKRRKLRREILQSCTALLGSPLSCAWFRLSVAYQTP